MIFEADVGFRDRGSEANFETLQQMREHGEVIDAAGAKYLKWAVGEGVELWSNFENGRPELLFSPYYAGEARMTVALIERSPRTKSMRADGAFLCRGCASAGANWVAGRNPFVFDALGFHRYDGLSLPRLHAVQLTAFAFQMTGYEDESEYDEANPPNEKGYVWNYRHFIPAYLMRQRREDGELQDACARVSGFVRDAGLITNPLTGDDFCWARVATIGGEVDMVCSPDRLSGYLVKDGIAMASCYLFGRLIEDDSN
ncbi:MAG TPA: hypothetical protein VJ866_15155 [Pyrinomonadaceae bacterium]|nr:hypothetical protein [Pyrinomonadaceae bacterium]